MASLEIREFLLMALWQNLSTNGMAYPFGGTRENGIGVGSLANPLLRWEKTGQFNVGLDLGFLRAIYRYLLIIILSILPICY